MRLGAPFRQPEWSALALLEAPEFVSRVHRAFIDAGADVITTNSYAVVPFHIGARRFQEQGLALAQLAGRLAREAAGAGSRVRVAGSLPPACGSYRAEWFDAELARPTLQTLMAGMRPFVDHWQAETLSCIAEAELVRELVGSDARPLWLSFTLADDATGGARESRLRSGERVLDAVAAATNLGAQALLFNCSQPEVMGPAVSIAVDYLGRQTSAPTTQVGVYANAFPPAGADAQANDQLHAIRADLTPRGYLSWVQDWLGRGAQIVGGCCGIGPEHIRLIRGSIAA